MLSFRQFAIRYATPAYWGTSPRTLGRALKRFSEVEGDSGWQAMQIVHASDDPMVRAAFFQIALEEASHASWFREAALLTCADIEDGWESRSREAIYSKGGDLSLSIVEFEVNERIVYLEFEEYATASASEYVKAIFQKVRLDEAGHGDKFHSTAKNEAEELRLQRLLRKAHARRRKRNLVAVSRFLGDAVAQSFLVVIFYIFGGLSKFIGLLRRRRTQRLFSGVLQSGRQ